MSVALGDYRFAHWGRLAPEERQRLENIEWTLLNNSSDLITMVVGLALAEVEKEFKAITAVIEHAREVLKTVTDFKNVLSLAAGVIALGAAIVVGVVSENPAPIIAAVTDFAATLKVVAQTE